MLAPANLAMQVQGLTGPCEDGSSWRSQSPEKLVQVLERQEEVISSLLEQCQALELEGNSLVYGDSFVEADEVTLKLQAELDALRAAAEINLKDQEMYLEASERAQNVRRVKPQQDVGWIAQTTPRLSASRSKGPLVPSVASPKASGRRPPSARPSGSGTASPPRGAASPPRGMASPPREARQAVEVNPRLRSSRGSPGPGVAAKGREVRAAGFSSAAGRFHYSDSAEAQSTKLRAQQQAAAPNGQVLRRQASPTVLPRRTSENGKVNTASTPSLSGQASSSMPRRASSPSMIDAASVGVSRPRYRAGQSPSSASNARNTAVVGGGSVNAGVGRAFRFVPRSVSPPQVMTGSCGAGGGVSSAAGRRAMNSRGGSPRSKGTASPGKPCASPKTPLTPPLPQHQWQPPPVTSSPILGYGSNSQRQAKEAWPNASSRGVNGSTSQVSASPRQSPGCSGSPRQGLGGPIPARHDTGAVPPHVQQELGSGPIAGAMQYSGPLPWVSEWPPSLRPA
mmetsp:Transcript_60148/g.143365  ORF Transcript_60148/g.143365 Transcript_60148/m.143365 type:complete len:510 (-) Transcript_60148:77-1606(-)